MAVEVTFDPILGVPQSVFGSAKQPGQASGRDSEL